MGRTGLLLTGTLSILRATSDRQTRKSELTVGLDQYFVFIFVTAENAVSRMLVKAKILVEKVCEIISITALIICDCTHIVCNAYVQLFEKISSYLCGHRRSQGGGKGP